MTRYPSPTDVDLAVVETTTDSLAFVQSRESLPRGGWWAVEYDGSKWRCGCAGWQQRGRCAHVTAVVARRRVLTPVSDGDPFTDGTVERLYVPGGAA